MRKNSAKKENCWQPSSIRYQTTKTRLSWTYTIFLYLYILLIGAVGTYTVFLYLYVPTIYTVGTYTIFPCFYVPLSFSVGIFQLSFCTYVPLSLFDGISQLSFCAYVPFSLFDGILQLPFLHMSLLFIQSGFIIGNNDFPCMFHLLFGRRLHIFQCIYWYVKNRGTCGNFAISHAGGI